MMHFSVTHVLLITSMSMVVLFLVLTALAVIVNWLTALMLERPAERKAEIEGSRPVPEISDAQGLNQIAAVVGVALARAQAKRAHPRTWKQKPLVGFKPWRDLLRIRTADYLDRGWRPR